MFINLIVNLFIFIVAFYFCLFSVIGFGELFQKIVFSKIKNYSFNLEFNGFYGLFGLTLVSLITSIFLAHNFIHNSILLSFGFFYFFFSDIYKNKRYIKNIFIISVLVFSALLISKTHDDFSYYHLPFTKYLTEHHIIFGMGHLNLGYNFISSLFYLNSIFYLPFIKFYSFHFSVLFFLIFFNYYLLKNIFYSNKKEIIKFLLILTFCFFNLSFNRIAEYGTDKAGQLLITLIVISLINLILFEKKKDKINQILFLIPLIALCISLKTYFLSYLLLGFVVFLIDKNYLQNIYKLLFSKSFLSFILILTLFYLHHFISTGCIISPIPSTCFGSYYDWSIKLNKVEELSKWVELWAKGGAGPTFRIEDPNLYIQNLNWVSNWFDVYFKKKFLDQILILLSCSIVVIFLFRKFQFENLKIKNLEKFYIVFIYFILIVIFCFWFFKHPTLRYGGYSIFFLVFIVPLMTLAYLLKVEKKNLHKKKLILVIFVFMVFNLKNFNRINNEFNRDDHYKFDNFPFFALKEKKYLSFNLNNLTLYSAHHCWATPSPCGQINEKITTYKKGSYFFIKTLD